jgi:succinate dehydrogenase / fumarate reductase membrane anchor subunit
MDLMSCLECNESTKMASRTILKESQIMKIHYITGIAAIFVVALHIMMRLVVPFEQSLEYDYIIANYKNIIYVLILESILVLISVHGFNGIRIILLELRQSRAWENMVTVVTISAMIGLIGYGTRTIILANGL